MHMHMKKVVYVGNLNQNSKLGLNSDPWCQYYKLQDYVNYLRTRNVFCL